MTDQSDDCVWVTRCLKGEAAAFEPLVERYQRVLFSVALRLLGNYDDAKDATQNAFIRAYEHLDSFDPNRRFFSWIYRIAVHESLNFRRARRPQQQMDPGMSVTGGQTEAVEAREMSERIELALGTLSAEYREVVVLRYFGELSYEEISEALGVPEKTVKSRLFSARQRLATELGS